jgi:hypothetical protein
LTDDEPALGRCLINHEVMQHGGTYRHVMHAINDVRDAFVARAHLIGCEAGGRSRSSGYSSKVVGSEHIRVISGGYRRTETPEFCPRCLRQSTTDMEAQSTRKDVDLLSVDYAL